MPIVKCNICDNDFYVKPSHQKLGYGKYCSRECQYSSLRKGKFVKCATCHNETWKAPKALKGSLSGKYFCSKSCQTIWRNHHYSGARHPNWKDGSSKDYRKIIRKSEKKEICIKCGCDDKRVLIVHHINKKRTNNRISNLEWRCLNCHHLVHRHNER